MATQITNDNLPSADDSDVIFRSTSNEIELKTRFATVCKALRYLAFSCAIIVGCCAAALYYTSNSGNGGAYRFSAIMKTFKVFIPKNGNNENGVFFNLNK